MMAINLRKEEKPKGWVICSLPDFTHIEMGQSPPSSTYNHEGIGLPFFQGKAEFTELHPQIDKYCSQPNKIAKAGATLLTVRAPVGPTNLAEVDCCIGRGLAGIHPLDSIEPKFVLLLMRSIEHDISGKGTGSTFTAINKTFLEELTFALPPLIEQKRIVAKTEELFSELDKGIENLKTARAQLKIYRQAVLKHAFEGKLTQQWRENNKDKLIRDEEFFQNFDQKKKIKNYETPQNWFCIELAGIGKIETGNTPSKKHLEYYGDKYPFYKPTDLEAGYSVRTAREYLSEEGIEQARCLPEGSVLVTCIGATIGKTGIIRETGASNQQINSIIPSQHLLPDFVYFQAISPFFQDQIKNNYSQTTLPILNKSKFSKLAFFICSKEEQERVVNAINYKLSAIDKIEVDIEEQLSKAEALRQSILKQAFSGKLVEQDPNDEPASVLLERIKTEKENTKKKNRSAA